MDSNGSTISRRTMLAAAGTLAALPSAARTQGGPAASQPDIPLWPEASLAAERIHTPVPIDPKMPKAYHPVIDVTRPLLTPYRPEKPNGAAIITCPGGGYVIVGRSAGPPSWFAARGFWVFDLLYRLPGGGWRAGPDSALQDVQQAVRLVRSRATAFGIDPARIGVAGFSAGGHVAASAATRFAEDLASPARDLAPVSARPDFALLACPVITLAEPHRHGASARALVRGTPTPQQVETHSAERRVSPQTPPCFLAHASDDRTVSPQNSILMFSALRQAGVGAELHIFGSGGHDMGQGFKPESPVSAYPSLFTQWLGRSGIAAPATTASRG